MLFLILLRKRTNYSIFFYFLHKNSLNLSKSATFYIILQVYKYLLKKLFREVLDYRFP